MKLRRGLLHAFGLSSILWLLIRVELGDPLARWREGSTAIAKPNVERVESDIVALRHAVAALDSRLGALGGASYSRPGDLESTGRLRRPGPSREPIRAEASPADPRAELARLPEWYASEPETPDAVIYENVGAIVRGKIARDVRAEYDCRGQTCRVELAHENTIELMQAAQKFMFAFPGEMMIREDPQHGRIEIYARAVARPANAPL